MIRLKIVEDIEQEPITLNEVKEWLSIDYNDWDNLLSMLLTAAREQSEKVSGQAYGVKTFEVTGNEKSEKVYPVQPFIEDVDWEDEEGNCKYRYKAGFEKLPQDLKVAVLQRVATGFAYRQNGVSEAVNATVNHSNQSELKYAYLWV